MRKYAGMYKAIIFDFDGTIANTLEVTVDTYNEFAPRFRCKRINPDDLERLRNGRPQELMAEFHISAWKLPFVLFAIRKGLKHRKVLPQEGIIAALRDLKSRNILLGILTSNSKENVESFLKENALEDTFAFIKSYRRVFGKHRALREIVKARELNPAEVMYVGDEVRDIEAAKTAGVKSMGVTWGFQTRPAIEAAGPDIVATKPGDILERTK